MVTILNVDTECILCGQVSMQTIFGQTERLGLPDLDTRPPESLRSTLPFWVKRCPHCGYCAPDIDREYPLAEKVSRRADYQALLRKRSFPQSARQFLAWALIQLANGEILGAGWSALHAAWACDDAGKTTPAAACRQQALTYFERARQGGKALPGFEDPAAEQILLADLYRRIGQFEQAVAVCRQALDRRPTLVIRRTLEHEIILCVAHNTEAHSLADVTGAAPGILEVPTSEL
jgi:hypothetical protein